MANLLFWHVCFWEPDVDSPTLAQASGTTQGKPNIPFKWKHLKVHCLVLNNSYSPIIDKCGQEPFEVKRLKTYNKSPWIRKTVSLLGAYI